MASDHAGFFSRARWGPGSVSFIIILIAIAMVILIYGRFKAIYIFESGVIFLIVVIFILIKAAERITIVGSGTPGP